SQINGDTGSGFQYSSQDVEQTGNISEAAYTRSVPVPDLQELYNVARSMRSNAAPGPDGLSAGFCKSAWAWVVLMSSHGSLLPRGFALLKNLSTFLTLRCSFARAVWFSSKTPLRTSLLPSEQDGVQEILANIICSATTELQFQRIMTTLWLPILIEGPRCYSDASIAPDINPNDARPAGLGVFFLDPNRQLKCYIKARTEQVNSVLMAKTAAMALAAKIISLIGIREISFLTDNQLLANFFSGTRYDEPPHWDIRPFS
ncbi:hypothetical protein U9M48_037683, partial [Paspalum notatum var. saurae]